MYMAWIFGGDDENKDSTSGKDKRITKFKFLDIVVFEQSILWQSIENTKKTSKK